MLLEPMNTVLSYAAASRRGPGAILSICHEFTSCRSITHMKTKDETGDDQIDGSLIEDIKEALTFLEAPLAGDEPNRGKFRSPNRITAPYLDCPRM